MTSVIRRMPEENINKERVFNDKDSGKEFCDSKNLDFNREYLLTFLYDLITFVAVIELSCCYKKGCIEFFKI